MAYPVSQSDPTAVFGRRVLATVIDAVVVGGPAIAAATSQFEYYDVPAGQSGGNLCDAYLETHSGGSCMHVNDTIYFSDGVGGGASGVGLGLALLVFVILQGLTGWTPGKLITGIRTVKADGSIVGIPKAFVRWILLIVDGQPCGLPLVGFITGLTTQGHRRVGDMAAKTFVVDRSAVGSPITVPGLTAPPAPPSAWGTPVAPTTTTWGGPTAPSTGAWGSPTPPSGAWGTPTPPATSVPPAEPTAAGWAAPSSSPASTPAAGAAAPPPQWDAARGTYIQWDPAQNAWLQWDEPSKRWIRIPGQ